MAAATAAQIRTLLAAVLKMDESGPNAMPDYWDAHCEAAATAAYYQCRDGLLSRGFLPEHVAAWDRLYEFTLHLGVREALLLGGAYADAGAQTVERLERKADELAGNEQKGIKPVLVFVGDEWIKPAADRPGQAAGAGPTVAQASGVFRFDDSDPIDKGIPI